MIIDDYGDGLLEMPEMDCHHKHQKPEEEHQDSAQQLVEEGISCSSNRKPGKIRSTTSRNTIGMADFDTTAVTSTSGSSSSPPISVLAQDHLFSILLLLPAESIFSFASTCRKFRALVDSDTLWETFCRREWGNSSVDALKASSSSSSDVPHLSWKKLYQQLSRLDSVRCRRIFFAHNPDADSERLPLPLPRASHSLNFVSGCLVLFGGGAEGGRHLDDTWVAYIGNDFNRMMKWQKVRSASGIPSGRFGHSCVVVGDTLVLFGGINDSGIRHNDTWIGQIGLHDKMGITLSWRQLEVGSTAPPARGAHAGCCIGKNRMLIHGGIGPSGDRLGDTWILDLSENLSLGDWQEILARPSPPSCSGHTVTYIGGDQTILFGGRGSGYEVLNEVWLFDASEGHWRWVQLLFELQNIPQGLSLPRVGHSATLILGQRLLIYGGEDSQRHRKDDFWVLDTSSIPSARNRMQSSNLGPKGLFNKMWRRLKCKGDNPNSRSFHRACVDHSGRYVFVFGGMVDGLLQPTEAIGLRFDGGLFLVELLLQC